MRSGGDSVPAEPSNGPRLLSCTECGDIHLFADDPLWAFSDERLSALMHIEVPAELNITKSYDSFEDFRAEMMAGFDHIPDDFDDD